MSRIGRLPITVPAGVKVDISNENVVVVTGPLGSLRQPVDTCIAIEKKDLEGKEVVVLTRNSEEKTVKAKHGLYRALIANMIEGVTKGYSKTLIVNGVGYKCSVAGDKLVMNIGFSHPINYTIPTDVKITCVSATEIKVDGCDKTRVGQVAADIKAFKPIEPYHGYGIKYSDQFVLRKEIKKAAKKK